MLSLLVLRMAAAAAEPGYVDAARCRPCHTAIYDSYSKTGMARTFAAAGEVSALDRFEHSPSKRWYGIELRGGEAWLTRNDREGNRLEKRIDFAIGSGAHSRTFASRTRDGRLTELPLSWYSEGGGGYAMSPGYDRAGHSDFRREVSDACLFCHNAYPSKANGGLGSGIDCQRCHGPGEGHVERLEAIVNPARLTSERKLEVCLQCHLESASRTLPDAVRRFGRQTFSYRPGEPLGDYQVYFDFARAPNEERITVNNSAYGLMRSACFVRSSGKLTCTTCHDPHKQVTGSDSYTGICRSCHDSAHAGEPAKACTGCHMPKRRTEDAVHVVLTDHFIRRRPLAEDPLARLEERHDRLNGAVRALYPAKADATYLAMAQARSSANPAAEARKLEAMKPTQAEAWAVMGEAYRKAGRARDALGAYRRALALGARETSVYVATAELLMQAERADEATPLIEGALEAAPRDSALRNTLAVLYGWRQRFADCVAVLEGANDDDSLTWLNRGVCHQALGQKQKAAADYDEAIRRQPDFERARTYRDALRGIRK